MPQRGSFPLWGFPEQILQRCRVAQRSLSGGTTAKSERRCLALGGRTVHTKLVRVGFAFGERRTQKSGTFPPDNQAIRQVSFPVDRGLSYSVRFSFCSIGESCNGLGAPRIGESMSKLGDLSSVSLATANDGLCGNGDISITSMAGAGEDGKGGVVMVSSIYVENAHKHKPSSTRFFRCCIASYHYPVQTSSKRTKTVWALPIADYFWSERFVT